MNGGFAVSIAPDGKFLYYTADRDRFTELRALHLSTRQETTIARDVLRSNYIATPNGVLIVSGQVLWPRNLKLWAPSCQVREIYRFGKPISERLGMPPDGSVLYLGPIEQDGAELVLVKGFWR
jgi:hypothetical protein